MKSPINIPISKLHPFRGHPYQVRDDDEMDALIESIQDQGILTPLIVRPLENTEDEYEIISGHQRLHAARKAGISMIPAFVYALDRDAAAIALFILISHSCFPSVYHRFFFVYLCIFPFLLIIAIHVYFARIVIFLCCRLITILPFLFGI